MMTKPPPVWLVHLHHFYVASTLLKGVNRSQNHTNLIYLQKQTHSNHFQVPNCIYKLPWIHCMCRFMTLIFDNTHTTACVPQSIDSVLKMRAKQNISLSLMLLATAPCYVKQYVNTNPCTLFKCCLSSLTGIFQMLLSGNETLQTASAKCIAAVLAHSSSQGSTPFIKADVPGDMHTQTHKHSGWNMLAIQAVAFFDFFSSTNNVLCLFLFESLFISLTVSLSIFLYSYMSFFLCPLL